MASRDSSSPNKDRVYIGVALLGLYNFKLDPKRASVLDPNVTFVDKTSNTTIKGLKDVQNKFSANTDFKSCKVLGISDLTDWTQPPTETMSIIIERSCILKNGDVKGYSHSLNVSVKNNKIVKLEDKARVDEMAEMMAVNPYTGKKNDWTKDYKV